MKKSLLPILLIVMSVAVGNAQTFVIGDMNGDGELNVSDVTLLVNTILGNSSPQYISGDDIIVESRDYVDLDLPSGTLWATCNLGATRPEEYKDLYYAWGETSTHPDKLYSWAEYKYCNGETNTITKYCSNSSYGLNGFTDERTELEAVDDVATAKWGKEWKTPTHEQQLELIDECNWTWTTLNGVEGYKVSSKKSNRSIFLPACGCRRNNWLEGPEVSGFHGGNYWSSSLHVDSPTGAWYLHIYYSQSYGNSSTASTSQSRFYGMQIRPVRATE